MSLLNWSMTSYVCWNSVCHNILQCRCIDHELMCHWNYDFCLINGKLMITNTYWTTTYTFTWCMMCPRGRGISLQGQNPPRFCPQGDECLDNDIWGRKHCNMQWMEMFEVRRKAHNECLQELLLSPSLNGRTHVTMCFIF